MRILSITIVLTFIASVSYNFNIANAWPNSEHECLAANIYYEARGEPLAGRMMVAQTTLNRVNSAKYPNTICKVVKQSKQFSWYSFWGVEKPKDKEAWNECLILSGKFTKSDIIDFSEGAIFYHATYIEPKWSKYKEYIGTVGNHRFYK